MVDFTKISKKEAAIRQLDTAITLFFENRDPISVHTLAGAARGVFMDRGLIEGKEPFIKQVETTFPKKTRSDLLRALNEFQNWFKHAGDPNEKVLESFKEKDNDLQLFVAVNDCFVVCESWPISAQVFQAWFYKVNPHLAPPTLEEYSLFEGDESLSKMSREKQKKEGLKVLKGALENQELKNHPKTFIIS